MAAIRHYHIGGHADAVPRFLKWFTYDPSILSSEMSRIFSLIGSLCSTWGACGLISHKTRERRLPACTPRTIGLNNRLPKSLSAQRTGTEAVRQADILSAFSAYIEAECNSAGRTNLESRFRSCRKERLIASTDYIRHPAEHSSSMNIHSKEAANGRAGRSPSQNRCSKQSSSTQSALSFY